MSADGMVVLAPLSCAEQIRWGCMAFEHPDRDDAPVLWRAGVDPAVLEVEAVPPRAGDIHLFDLRRWASGARLVQGEGCEHLLMGAGASAIRIDVVVGTVREGPVALVHRIGWPPDAERQLMTLRRLVRFCRTGQLVPHRPSMARAHRRALAALDVHDAWAAGASIRDVGIMLFGHERIQAEWNAPGESLKSSCRRWIRLARELAAGGYKGLLR